MKNKQAKQKKILAMKGNLEGSFSPHAWRIGNMERHGWVRVGDAEEKVDVGDVEVIPIVPQKEEDDKYPTDDEIRDFLKEKGVKFHPSTGTKKLKKLYDENSE